MKHVVLFAFLLCLSTITNGQAKKIIDDAWIFIGTWDSFRHSENIELVKGWDDPTVCMISFENRRYTVLDESAVYQEKGSWSIRKIENRDVIVVKIENGDTSNLEIVSVSSARLLLRRMK